MNERPDFGREDPNLFDVVNSAYYHIFMKE